MSSVPKMRTFIYANAGNVALWLLAWGSVVAWEREGEGGGGEERGGGRGRRDLTEHVEDGICSYLLLSADSELRSLPKRRKTHTSQWHVSNGQEKNGAEDVPKLSQPIL
jgi:hypothetical protein